MRAYHPVPPAIPHRAVVAQDYTLVLFCAAARLACFAKSIGFAAQVLKSRHFRSSKERTHCASALDRSRVSPAQNFRFGH